MKSEEHSRKFYHFRNIRFQTYMIAILTFLLQLRHFQGEDIVNARNNYRIGEKTDFWGGASTLFYSHIPSIGIKWQIWLALAQVIFSAIGLSIFFGTNPTKKRLHFFSLALIYFAFVLGSQMTRDGLQLSLLILGFGLLYRNYRGTTLNFQVFISIGIIITAMSLRPWMSLAVIPLLFYMLARQKMKFHLILVAIIGLAIMPAILDLSAAKILNLKASYPQQQVMMMDLAATYCYSNNENSVREAKKGLNLFTRDPKYFDQLCEIYKPDTWESLTMAGHAAAKGLVTDFWLIEVGDSSKYTKLQNVWVSLIISDPISYVQNKILFIGKLVIGSDSRKVSLFSAGSLLEKTETTFKFPYEIAISLHLLSISLCSIFLMIVPCLRFLRAKREGFILDGLQISIFISLFLWSWLSAIAYIGSNGRYTYSISILGLIFYLSHLNDLVESHHEA